MDRVEFDYWKPRDVARLLSLVEAERRYFQEMMALLPVGVALVSSALELTMTNRAFRRMLGLERGNAADRRLDDLLGSPTLGDSVRDVLAGRGPRSIMLPQTETALGKRTLLVSFQPFREWDDENALEILLTMEDVTEMVGTALPAAPAATREIEAPVPPPPTPAMTAAKAMIMAKLAESSKVAESPAGPILKPALFGAIQWQLDVDTMKFLEVSLPVSLSDANLPAEAWQAGAEFWIGRVVPAHLPLVKTFYDQVLKGTPLKSVEYRATASGRTVWLRDAVRAVSDEHGRVSQLEGVTYDVTPLRQRDDSIAQAQKLDALTRLAGRVSHECNNLLTILGGHGEELLHALSPDNPLRANAQEILTAGDRLNKFTQQLSSFVKHPSPESTVVGVDALVSDYRDELRQILPSSVRLILNPGVPSMNATADPALLVLAIRSLALRGAEAMRGEGALSIETTAIMAADPTAASRAALAPGHYVQIAIRDTGHAIHPDLLQQLFEPPAGGEAPRHNLAAIYKSVREMGGDLTVTSEFDRGTCFAIVLPRAASLPAFPAAASAVVPPPPPPAPAAAPAPADPVVAAPPPPEPEPVRTETILVVEDEAGIRGLIRRILGRQNYEVIEAANGRQALEIARQHPGKIDMLLTDVVMPEMGGFDLASLLLKERPDLRVLFISGYTGLAGFDPSQLPAGSGFLQKPFTLNALLAKVREVFAQQKGGSSNN